MITNFSYHILEKDDLFFLLKTSMKISNYFLLVNLSLFIAKLFIKLIKFKIVAMKTTRQK